MISDTNEKTEPPPPLTQREMAQLVTLSTLPTLERALKRLRWLEAQNAALNKPDPLADMWRELSEYQPFADRDGHGESWRRLCSERTTAAADAARAVAAGAAARDAARAAAWDTERAAQRAELERMLGGGAAVSDILSKMKDADMPLLDRVEAALARVGSRQGLMRIPVEATDLDIVVSDCGSEIKRLRAELAKRTAELAQRTADLAKANAERDEARREVCFAYGPMAEAMAAAKRRGWNCFDAKEAKR